MNKIFIVTLTEEERSRLSKLISSGEAPARTLAKARILLKADSGGPNWNDKQISRALDVSLTMIARVRQRFVENSLEDALHRRKPCRQYKRKLDGEREAQLTTLACSQAPEGYERWSLRLLADKLVELEVVDSVSHETIRQVLKKTRSSLG